MKKMIIAFLALTSTAAFAQQSVTILGISNIMMGNTYLTTTAGVSAYLNCSQDKIYINGLSSARFPTEPDMNRYQATCDQVEDCAKRVNGTSAEQIEVILDTTSGFVLRTYLPNFCRW